MLFNFLIGNVVGGLKSAHRSACDIRNGLVGKVLIVAHRKHEPLFVGEFEESLAERAHRGVAVKIGVRVGYPLGLGGNGRARSIL